MVGGAGPLALRQIPYAGVPLADEAAPVFNGEVDRLVTRFESGFLIAFGGSSEHVDAVELTGGERDDLSQGSDGVVLAGSGWSKVEFNGVEAQLRGEHFGGHGVAFGIEEIGKE